MEFTLLRSHGPVVLAALVLSLSGCAHESRRIAHGPLRSGMTREDVATSWGAPASKARAASELGENEQWLYSDGRSAVFDNGILTSFEESESKRDFSR